MLAIYITCKDKDEATKIATALVAKKLAACANIFPTTSIYTWQGKLETSDEYILLAKTTEAKYKAVEREVLRLHSYECPCITSWKIDKTNPLYKKWVEGMVK